MRKYYSKTIFILCFLFIVLSCQRGKDMGDKQFINMEEKKHKNIPQVKINNENLKEFNLLIKKLLDEKLIDLNNFKIDTFNINEHPLIHKLLKRNLLDSNVSGKVLSMEYICKHSQIKNRFQVLYFPDEQQAIKTYRVFDRLVNSSARFEKPYKFFFRHGNKIFYITSDANITCSGKVIESLAGYFNYEVDYFKKFYASGRERVQY